MPAKKRVTLYLTTEVYRKVQELVARTPGLTASGLVDDLLAQAVETLGPLLDAAQAGDRDSQAELLARLMAAQILKLADEGVTALRKVKESGY